MLVMLVDRKNIKRRPGQEKKKMEIVGARKIDQWWNPRGLS
jgi:hypothetical protein